MREIPANLATTDAAFRSATREEKFFRDQMKAASCIIPDTTKRTIQETYETILRHLEQA